MCLKNTKWALPDGIFTLSKSSKLKKVLLVLIKMCLLFYLGTVVGVVVYSLTEGDKDPCLPGTPCFTSFRDLQTA